jgi:anti-anti-sigma factor
MATEVFSMESFAGRRTGHSVMRLSGALNSASEQKFLEQVRADTSPVVILELSGVHYCDSRGVAALVQIHNAFKRESRHLALVGLNRRVELVLEITRVKSLFMQFATLSEAEDALA